MYVERENDVHDKFVTSRQIGGATSHRRSSNTIMKTRIAMDDFSYGRTTLFTNIDLNKMILFQCAKVHMQL